MSEKHLTETVVVTTTTEHYSDGSTARMEKTEITPAAIAEALGSSEVQEELRPIAEELRAILKAAMSRKRTFEETMRDAAEQYAWSADIEDLRPLVPSKIWELVRGDLTYEIREQVRAFIEADEEQRSLILLSWEQRYRSIGVLPSEDER